MTEAKIGIAASVRSFRRMAGGLYSKRVQVAEASRGCLQVEAPKVSEAKERFAEAVERFLDVYDGATTICFRGATFIVTPRPAWPEPAWGYEIVHEGRAGSHCGVNGDKREAVRAAKRHLVQYTTDDYSDDAGVQQGFNFLAGNEEDQYEHLRYAAWQRAAKQAQDAGEPDSRRCAYENEQPQFERLVDLIEGALENKQVAARAGRVASVSSTST